MNGNQIIYCSKARNLPWYRKPAPKDQQQTFHTWLNQQTDLSQTKEGRVTNIELFWTALCLFGSNGTHLPVTVDNLNALKNSAQLYPLLEKAQTPAPKIPTPEERKQAEEELAKLEPSWRGKFEFTSTMAGVMRERVSYNSLENLDKLIATICDPNSPAYAYSVASGETLLIAFKHLLSKGELQQIRTPDRPTHNPPATRESVRRDLEKSEQEHQQRRIDAQEIRLIHAEFEADLKTVANYVGRVMASGLISHAATYVGQKNGMEQLHRKWDAKFESIGGDDLATYQKLVASVEKDIEKKNPNTGIRGVTRTGGPDPRTYSGGSFVDVMEAMPSTVTGQKHRDSLGEALSTDVKIPFNRR